MSHWSYKLDVTHARATNLRCCYFNAALFALDAFVAHLFIFATKTLVVADRSENFGTKQAVTLRF